MVEPTYSLPQTTLLSLRPSLPQPTHTAASLHLPPVLPINQAHPRQNTPHIFLGAQRVYRVYSWRRVFDEFIFHNPDKQASLYGLYGL